MENTDFRGMDAKMDNCRVARDVVRVQCGNL
jgi:hypothetical protein